MKKNLKSKNKATAAPRIDPYLEGLMGKLLERFVGLEKKMDIVIALASARPFGDGGRSKAFQRPEAKRSERRDRVLYEAICADCHKVCEVPFKPSEDRPVYCKECFAKRRAGGSGRGLPVLTPVVLSPKLASKLGLAHTATPPPRETPKKADKKKPGKKARIKSQRRSQHVSGRKF